MFDVIAFDADDTLWENEIFYTQAKEWLGVLLAEYGDAQALGDALEETEMRNIHHFGYGIKSFTLSMVETAIRATQARVSADQILQIVEHSKDMLRRDPRHFERVAETLEELARDYNLMLITKGDLFEQENKIDRSPLRTYFKFIEVVGSKTSEAYRGIMKKYAIQPAGFLMVGNSLRSDILPVLEAGGQAVYVPYENTWAHENEVEEGVMQGRYHTVEHLGELPELIRRLEEGQVGW
jgi:putative hydrolase of the HAD superfamily